ncbi:unnamed protein product [Brachionus calyciflorus]|uniref:EGF-like domain-containing protein n=1 Tax=Brachionus calyciflorus TaxID=104777 RepID=A0A813N5Y6_9BILA|nr:unnamed protein product [Brachionus calyciflorus]
MSLFLKCIFCLFFIESIICSNVFEEQIVLSNIVEDEVCRPSFCKTPSISTTIKEFCDKNKFSLEYRCCVNKALNGSNAVAIDYMGCNIQKLSNTIGALNREKIKNVQILDVRNNTIEECGNSETYSGFVNLNELYLSDYSDEVCSCPGGAYSWSNISSGTCVGRKNICQTDFSPFINCTETSRCVENGPGNFLCECKPNFHGYKCLEEGQFPTLMFSLILSLSTILLNIKTEAVQLVRSITERCSTETIPISQIYDQKIARLCNKYDASTIDSCIRPFAQIKTNLYKVRRKNFPDLPKSLEEIDLTIEYTQTKGGERLPLFDTKGRERVIGLASNRGLEI